MNECKRISAVLQGAVSRGVKDVTVRDDGHLIFTMTDKKVLDLGQAIGTSVENYELISGDHGPGSYDTYRMQLSDGRFFDVRVWNGRNGDGSGDMAEAMYDPDGGHRQVAFKDQIPSSEVLESFADHIADTENPHGVTAEQVGARPVTWTPTAAEVGARPENWTPTAAEVGARPNTWMPTAAEVGARPAGWTPTIAEVGGVEIERGSYTGTGQTGQNHPNTLTLQKIPNVIFIFGKNGSNAVIYYGDSGFTFLHGNNICINTAEWNGNSVSWYSGSGMAITQLNENGTLYRYMALRFN